MKIVPILIKKVQPANSEVLELNIYPHNKTQVASNFISLIIAHCTCFHGR
jgi:hypothetical protein